MSSRFYLILLAIVGACSLFGLGTMFGLGVVSEPAPRSRIDAATSITPRVVHSAAESAEEKRTADRKLSPIYPASPGGAEPGKAAEQSWSATAKTASAAAGNSEDENQPEQQDKNQSSTTSPSADAKPMAKAIADTPDASAEKAKKMESAKTEAQQSVSTPPSARAASCEVQACAAAYRSFRESDCTYQPYDGPRRLCVDPPAPERQQASSRRDQADDLRAAVEEVRRMTRGRDHDDDRGRYGPPPPAMPGRVIIVPP